MIPTQRTATVTSEVRAALVETLHSLLALAATLPRGSWLLQAPLQQLRTRVLHWPLLLLPGPQMPNVLQVDLTLLVADTQIDSAPFGKCGASLNSMSSHLRTRALPVKVYMVAGRAVTTDLDVLPSSTTGKFTVCAEAVSASYLR